MKIDEMLPDEIDENAFPGMEHNEPVPEEQAVAASVEEDAAGNRYLMVVIPLSNPQASPSGKSIVIASTGGFRPSNLTVDGVPVMIGVSAFIPVGEAVAAEPEPQDPNKWDGINRIITL